MSGDAEHIAHNYLRSRGHTIPQKEGSVTARDRPSAHATLAGVDYDEQARNTILLLEKQASHADPSSIGDSYYALRLWIENSLDMYKNELFSVLYPLFVHSYLDLVLREQGSVAERFLDRFGGDFQDLGHRDELSSLSNVTTPGLCEENETAQLFLRHRYNLRLSAYGWQLLVSFLRDASHFFFLRVLNEHCRVRIDTAIPDALDTGDSRGGSDGDPSGGLVGTSEQTALLRIPVHWGTLRESDYLIEDTEMDLEKAAQERAARERDAKPSESTMDDAGDSSKASSEIGIASKPSSRKASNAKGTGGTARAASGSSKVGHTTMDVSESIPLPEVWRSSGMLGSLEDLRARMKLSSEQLPSVLFYTLLNTHGNVNTVDILNDGSALIAGCDDSALRVFDVKQHMREQQNFHDDNSIATEIPTATAHRTLIGHAGPIYGVDVSADGRHCLSASEDGTVRLWDLQLGTDLVAYRSHHYPVWDVRFAPLGRYFLTVSHDRTAHMYCTDRVSPLRIFAGHMTDVDCGAWHPNCNYVATGSTDRTCRLWDCRTGDCVRLFCGHRAPVSCLAFSPCGRYMTSGDTSGAVLLHDLAEARCVTMFLEHTDSVWSMDFSKGDGALLATGSSDGTIRLWNTSALSGNTSINTTQSKSTRVLRTKSTPVYAVKFSWRNLLLAAGAFRALE